MTRTQPTGDAMDRRDFHLESDASLWVLPPILGLLGGLALGFLRSWSVGATDLLLVAQVVSGGIIGSALGMCAVLASIYRVGRTDLRSLKSLAMVVVIAALVTWLGLTLLAPILGGR